MIEFLLPAIPLLALVVSLLLGLYPGHGAAMRLAERIAARVRPRIATAVDSPRPFAPPAHAAGGGLLLALSLSGRAPPA